MLFRIKLIVLTLAAAALGFRENWSPALVATSLCLAAGIVIKACAAANGTALGPAVSWGAVATTLGVLSQTIATVEPITSGRSVSGLLTYLMTLCTLAALISVLNARTPGAGVWAILNVMLILVFLIPWLEGAGLRGAGRSLTWLRLDNPWTIFFGLLVLAGVTNYLPTKYGPAAVLLAIGFWLEYDALTHPRRPRENRALAWSYFPLAWAATLTVAESCSRATSVGKSRFDAFWLFFRDHWGVVWALRVQERFNRSADTLGWPIRLTWQGVVTLRDGEAWNPSAAESMLLGLLRRFVTADRIARSVAADVERPCHETDVR